MQGIGEMSQKLRKTNKEGAGEAPPRPQKKKSRF